MVQLKRRPVNTPSWVQTEYQPHLLRLLEEANDIESNPGPKSPKKELKTQARKKPGATTNGRSVSLSRKAGEGGTPPSIVDQDDSPSSVLASSDKNDEEKMSRLETEIALLQETLETVDSNVGRLQQAVDQLRPIYNEAKIALGSTTTQIQKNNLVFYGIEPDPLEIDMMSEPDFCRDILETRIKGILREHLKISREISFHQVARIYSAPPVNGTKPIVACFVNWKDKENILRQAKLLKGVGISITEDISNKAYVTGGKNGKKRDSDPGSASASASGDETQREERGFASGYNSSSASGTD